MADMPSMSCMSNASSLPVLFRPHPSLVLLLKLRLPKALDVKLLQLSQLPLKLRGVAVRHQHKAPKLLEPLGDGSHWFMQAAPELLN